MCFIMLSLYSDLKSHSGHLYSQQYFFFFSSQFINIRFFNCILLCKLVSFSFSFIIFEDISVGITSVVSIHMSFKDDISSRFFITLVPFQQVCNFLFKILHSLCQPVPFFLAFWFLLLIFLCLLN